MKPIIQHDPRRQSKIFCDGRTSMPFAGARLRIFWARRAVQLCIGSDAKLISTIVAEESIGGIHLADFTTLLRLAGDLDPVLRRRDSNRD